MGSFMCKNETITRLNALNDNLNKKLDKKPNFEDFEKVKD